MSYTRYDIGHGFSILLNSGLQAMSSSHCPCPGYELDIKKAFQLLYSHPPGKCFEWKRIERMIECNQWAQPTAIL